MRPLSSRQKLLLGSALAVAVVVGGLFAFWPKEPKYKGHNLSYWLERLPPANVPGAAYSDWSSHETAIEAIQAIGPACLPTLEARMSETHAIGTALNWTFSRESMSRPLSTISDLRRNLVLAPKYRRLRAATALKELGNTAKPVVPKLVELSKSHRDPGVRACAMGVLWHLSPADFLQVVMAQTNVLAQVTH
jgi:hypothetical protein